MDVELIDLVELPHRRRLYFRLAALRCVFPGVPL
jgi:hypothetical protein